MYWTCRAHLSGHAVACVDVQALTWWEPFRRHIAHHSDPSSPSHVRAVKLARELYWFGAGVI